jgi:predicted Zn-dependent peptidase
MAPADVVSTAAKYLAPEAVQIVAVGDAEKIVPVLKAFGQVEVRDTEGRPLAGF